jgi:hypothetical protein
MLAFQCLLFGVIFVVEGSAPVGAGLLVASAGLSVGWWRMWAQRS